MRSAANHHQRGTHVLTSIAIILFIVAGLCGMIRLLIGPGLADRIMALDVCLIALMGAISVDAARSEDTTNLIFLVVIAIIGFTATVSASRFLEEEQLPLPEVES